MKPSFYGIKERMLIFSRELGVSMHLQEERACFKANSLIYSNILIFFRCMKPSFNGMCASIRAVVECVAVH